MLFFGMFFKYFICFVVFCVLVFIWEIDFISDVFKGEIYYFDNGKVGNFFYMVYFLVKSGFNIVRILCFYLMICVIEIVLF